MIDVKPSVAALISDVADVELAFPKKPEQLPVITLTETGNDALVILSGADRYSVITLQTDVFAGDPETVTLIAEAVSSRLSAKGIKRTFSQLITDEPFPRMCMRFRLGVDELTGRVVTI